MISGKNMHHEQFDTADYFITSVSQNEASNIITQEDKEARKIDSTIL